MSGGIHGSIFRVAEDGSVEQELQVGYCAEVRIDHATGQLLVLESDANSDPMKYFVRLIDAETLTETARREIPVRPMYTGLPGRSVAGCISSCGRYVYFLRSGPVIQVGDDLAFRLTPARWDRASDAIEVSAYHVDSCHVDYGLTEAGEDTLFIHLSCEYASTISFSSFRSPDGTLLQMEQLPSRVHGPLETNGSWHDPVGGYLYCVNRKGTIYKVNLKKKTVRVLAALKLVADSAVPIHQVTGSLGLVHVGIARDGDLMSRGMVGEVWSVSAKTGKLVQKCSLPFPVVNFVVTPDGKELIGANPYARLVFRIDFGTGKEIWTLREIGRTPAEITLFR